MRLRPVRGAALTARAGWGLADAAFSSLTNFALSVVILRTGGVSAFGAFTIVYVIYLETLGVCRALVAEALLLRFSAREPAVWRAGVGEALGFALVLGSAAGLAAVSAGTIAPGLVGDSLLALGVGLPGLLVQDVCRFAFFAAGNGRLAFASDVAWAVLLLPGLAAFLSGHLTIPLFVLAWVAAGSGAGIVAVLLARVRVRLLAYARWWRTQKDLGLYYLGDFGLVTAALHIPLFAIGAIGGLAVVGTLRGADTLLGPLNVLTGAASLVGVAEGTRLLRRSVATLRRAGVAVSLGLCGVTLLWGGLLLLLPDSAGTAILGPAWFATHHVLAPVTLEYAVQAAGIGAMLGLRSLGLPRRTVAARATGVPLAVVGAVVGVRTWGAVGAAAGLAVAFGLSCLVWWWQFRAGLRARDGEAGQPTEPAEPQRPAPVAGAIT